MADEPGTERLREELAETRRQLTEEYQMASLGRLLAGIVHEINTPIGSIFSNNQVILRSLELIRNALDDPQPASVAKARKLLDTCHNLASIDRIACERISSVIRGIKTFARGDDAEMRKVDLNEQLRNTLKLTAGEFRRRIAVEEDFGDLPEVECQSQKLNQVFLNLLVNAGHAIQGEGRIVVRTRQEGNGIHISISDTGHGIRPEDRDKVFQRGFTTKEVGIGTGLGLPISREIVENEHGGTLDFESEPGKGTTFHIRIPIRQERQDATGTARGVSLK
jgi:two-component system NtrC family sensor kinase